MSDLVRLTLSFPPVLETAITDALIADPRMPGFTLLHAEGHTGDFSGASAGERVRGRMDRRLLWIIIDAAMRAEVMALLRASAASRQVRWWVEPVLEMGRLA